MESTQKDAKKEEQNEGGEGELINLIMKMTGNQEFNVNIPPDLYVEDLKDFLSNITNDLPSEMKLLCKGKVLKDDQSLKSYNIKDKDSIIYITAKIEGIPHHYYHSYRPA